MIYFLLLLTIILLTIVQFGFFFSLKNKDSVTNYLQLPKESKLPLFIFGISSLLFFIILFLLLKKLSSPQPLPNAVITQAKKGILPLGVEELGHNSYATGDSYYYLYTNTNKSKETIAVIAQQIKESVCIKDCTLNFYDDRKAYVLDQERSVIIIPKTMEDWNKKNYVYVANHYLGYLPAVSYEPFSYYPYKDLYYKKSLSSK